MKIVCINHIIEVNEGPQNYDNLLQLLSASQHILFCQNKILVFNIFFSSIKYVSNMRYIKEKKKETETSSMIYY